MRNRSPAAPIKVWSGSPLPADVRQSLARLSQADDVCHIAVMPDVHLTVKVCNGVALATKELIYPEAVGGDIGCGMLAAAFNGEAQVLSSPRQAEAVLTELARRIPANRHGAETMPAALPDELDRTPLSTASLDRLKHRDGRVQLGTLGRGNHFVELQADADDRLWIMIHSGSRGMGQEISTHHLAQAVRHGPGGLCALDSGSESGAAYLRDLDWAIRYADANRLAMLAAAAGVVKDACGYRLDDESLIHIHHNHVRREVHAGQSLWVHRKGAMPADEGQAGVIPGSMGTPSFHVMGRGCEAALRSSSHGAGRLLPRSVAARRISRKEFAHQMQHVWFDASQADRLRDESPAAYKDIRAVMRSQRELTRIWRELRPVLVYKGT